MADTTFVDGVTLLEADWHNDVNRLQYTILGDPATLAALQATLYQTTPANGTFLILTANTRVVPDANNGADIGSTSLGWAALHMGTGSTLNWANGDWVATHSAGILTVGTGDLRVTTAGTNTASVVTVGGTQTLTNKTLTSPVLGGTATGTYSLGGTPTINVAAAVGGTWTAAATWTLPAHTLGGTVSGGGNQLNNVIVGTSTPLAGTFTALTATGAFGCNGSTAQTAFASGGALNAYGAGANGLDSGANMSALHALVVAMRAALVANGIMS